MQHPADAWFKGRALDAWKHPVQSETIPRNNNNNNNNNNDHFVRRKRYQELNPSGMGRVATICLYGTEPPCDVREGQIG
jgi:hypothetical protein